MRRHNEVTVLMTFTVIAAVNLISMASLFPSPQLSQAKKMGSLSKNFAELILQLY